MGLKNKIYGLITCMALFTACSEEIPVDYTNDKTEFLSITFSAKSIETKAQTAIATEEERKVSNCFIGFFELDKNGNPGNMICGDYYEVVNNVGQNYNYKVSNIVVPQDKMEKDVRVLVIANPPSDNIFKNYSTYQDFTGINGKGIVSYKNANEFNPSLLIKVGETNHDFSSDKMVSIDLRQLAAKIHLQFAMERKENEVENEMLVGGKYTWEYINSEINKNGIPYEISTYVKECKDNGAHNHQEGSGKWAILNCDSIQTKIVKTWNITVSEIMVNNIVLNSPVVFNRSKRIEKKLGELVDINNISLFPDSVECFFYTYQNEYLSDDLQGNALTVQIKGLLNSKENTFERRKNGNIHAFWTTDGKTVAKKWSNGKFFKESIGSNWGFDSWSTWDVTNSEEIDNVGNSTYKAIINPKETDTSAGGILAGSCYNVSAILKVNEKLETDIHWVVVNIEQVDDINIPSFK